MKRIFISLAIATLLFSCADKQAESTSQTNNTPVSHVYNEQSVLPIAVINYDTLLSNYDLAIEANEALMKKEEDMRLEVNQKARQLQNEVMEFQNKLENNAFLSRERAEQEQRRLMQKEQDIQKMQESKSQEILVEQQNMAVRLRDSLNSVLSTINKDGKYHLILTTNALNENVLYSAPQYNITQEVIDMLNARYNKGK